MKSFKIHPKMFKKKLFLAIFVFIFIIFVAISGALADRFFNVKLLDMIFPRLSVMKVEQKIINEESDVIEVVEKYGPSVVTVSSVSPVEQVIRFSPFGGFTRESQGGSEEDIGSGFIVSEDGLIITNKHVVSDTGVKYKVSTSDGKTYEVKTINKDPNNDIAILKIDANGLTPVVLGDSSNLQVGQFVIAIGTALGEFRNTVTTGVISGLGRGIYAGSVYQGYVERLDDVIQTDAAINSGNSGGPLLNSSGEVIGINVAVARSANNIAFSIPINVVKESLKVFQTSGKFPAKAYLGVEYQIISERSALMNEVPQGAYVINVVSGSPAEKAGVRPGDIIYKIDGNSVTEKDGGLSKIISGKKVGDIIKLTVWRDGETKEIPTTF